MHRARIAENGSEIAHLAHGAYRRPPCVARDSDKSETRRNTAARTSTLNEAFKKEQQQEQRESRSLQGNARACSRRCIFCASHTAYSRTPTEHHGPHRSSHPAAVVESFGRLPATIFAPKLLQNWGGLRVDILYYYYVWSGRSMCMLRLIQCFNQRIFPVTRL